MKRIIITLAISSFCVFAVSCSCNNSKKSSSVPEDEVQSTSISNESETINSSNESETINSNWNDVLDEYERLVNEYGKFYAKVLKGDMSAITEYTDLMERIEQFSDKFSSAESQMSADQMDRYLKVSGKLTSLVESSEDKIESAMEKMEDKMDAMEDKMDAMEDKLEAAADKMEDKMEDKMDDALDKLEDKLDNLGF